MPSLTHLTFCTPTKSNLYLANSLAAVVREPDLHRLLTFQVPNLMSLFYCLGQSRSEACVSGSKYDTFLWRGVVSTLPNPPSWRSTLVGCPQMLIQHIRSYPPYWRPFLHSQPEDAPCMGNRDPLIMVCLPHYLLCLWQASLQYLPTAQWLADTN